MQKLNAALLSAALLTAGTALGTSLAPAPGTEDQGKKPWVVDIGEKPLKVYAICATVEEAAAAEHHHH